MKISYWFLVVFFLMNASAYSQTNITVRLLDSLHQEPLMGAIVLVAGTNNGAFTDSLGKAQLTLTANTSVSLKTQFLGYTSKLILIQKPSADSLYTILLAATTDDLEEVIISSSRTNSRIEDIPTRIEILGQEEMKEENGIMPGKISSLLGDIAGIQLQQVSANTGNTLARMQGLNGRYTQLLQDGLPLYGGLSGGTSIMQIPPIDLKQIEIIKGSSSTLYGGDAIGGIINLISKDPSIEPTLTFTANQTSLYETNLNGYASRKYKKWGFTLFAGQTNQKVGDIDKDGLSDVPQVQSTVVHPKLVIYLAPKSTLTLNCNLLFDKRGGGRMAYFATPNDTLFHLINHIQRQSGDVKLVHAYSAKSSLTVKFSTCFVQQNLNTANYQFAAKQWMYYSEIAQLHTFKKNTLVYGINWNGSQLNKTSPMLESGFQYTNTIVGSFIQNTWKPTNKWIIEGGLRVDAQPNKRIFTLPRLCVLYKINSAFSIRANEGVGYKIPQLITNLNLETDLNKVGSFAALNPEIATGSNVDFNFHQKIGKKGILTLNQAFYFTQLKAPVVDSVGKTGLRYLYNAPAPINTQGFQTYVRYQYEELEVYLSYVYTNLTKKYDATHPTPVATPKHNLSSVVVAELSEHWKIGLEGSFIAGQLQQNYAPARNYSLFAMMVRYQVGKFIFVANVENLLDVRQSKFETIYDGTLNHPVYRTLYAPIEGRVFNVSLQYSLH